MGDAPVAGRLRRPGWRDPRLLMGVLLIAISVTAVTAVVRSADQTSGYYAARSTLTPGSVVTRDDVRVVRVRLEGGDYVAAGEEPWGRVVTRVVGKGELLPTGALAAPDAFDARTIAVQTSLPLAEGIDAGSTVDVYLTSDDDSPSTRVVARGLTVESVEHDAGSFSGTTVETVYVV
ncbi:MAG: hypothetical protein HGA51_09880, partial [Demequinaceae bacterium]|nr:hypothetical protein [Demequinaceae bacterium]